MDACTTEQLLLIMEAAHDSTSFNKTIMWHFSNSFADLGDSTIATPQSMEHLCGTFPQQIKSKRHTKHTSPAMF